MYTYSDFFRTLKNRGGLARTNRFYLDIPFPQEPTESEDTPFGKILKQTVSVLRALKNVKGEDVNGLSIMAENASLPDKALVTSEHTHNNQPMKMPYGIGHADAVFSFLLSKDHPEKQIMDAWFDMIYNQNTHSFGYLDSYTTDITIVPTDNYGAGNYGVVLQKAYPIAVDAVEYSNTSTDEYARMNVTFAYHKAVSIEDALAGKTQTVFDLFSGENTFGEIITNPSVMSKVYDIITTGEANFNGEAKVIFDKISGVVQSSTGSSANEVSGLLRDIKNDLDGSRDVSSDDKSSLNNTINDLLNRIG